MLAEIESETVRDYVDRMRHAVDAGRRDLGPECFKEAKGHFWGLIETRPFMRAMAMLSDALIGWGTAEAVDESIKIQEEMLELNPNDNQGVRDWLAGCYLARKRYDDAAALFERYPDDRLAAPAWARVLHAYVTGSEKRASEMLTQARERNAHVEEYLTGRKRRPRTRTGAYSPGDEAEAVYCADMLREAWKKHPKAKKWLKEACEPQGCYSNWESSVLAGTTSGPRPRLAKQSAST
jgi:tetratricopeptide (TPR) repeat protein